MDSLRQCFVNIGHIFVVRFVMVRYPLVEGFPWITCHQLFHGIELRSEGLVWKVLESDHLFYNSPLI